MRALILAQGDGRRWLRPDGTMPLGVPKHLVAPDGSGEALLHRTVRLLRERGVSDVVVVGPADPRYRPDGARLVTLNDPHPTGTSMDKLFATRPLWDDQGRTTILWGDVYYTGAVIDQIAAAGTREPHWWRRPGPSSVTGHRWDESFALTFLPGHHERLIDIAHQVNRAVPADRIHMWSHYAAWLGLNPARVGVAAVADTPQQTHVDDWTDDFDSWDEYCAWTGRYHRGAVDVAVAVPWWDTGCPHRALAASWTRAWWEQHAQVPVVYGSGRSRSEARNDAIARAEAEVVFVADADTWVTGPQLWAAAHLARSTGRLVHGYETHVRLARGTTGRFLTQPAGGHVPSGQQILGASNGAVAMSAGLLATVGGYDERFTVWGGEDRAHQFAAETLAGRGERVAGRSWHLWHPADPAVSTPQDPARAAGTELALRYKAAAGFVPEAGVLRRSPGAVVDVEGMWAILREPGGPLDPAAAAGGRGERADPSPPPPWTPSGGKVGGMVSHDPFRPTGRPGPHRVAATGAALQGVTLTEPEPEPDPEPEGATGPAPGPVERPTSRSPVADWRTYANLLGLPTDGTKAQLMNRVTEHEHSQDQAGG